MEDRVQELLRPYARVITPEADGGYSAEIVEFPGCVTQGETVEEAYANLEDAARGWLEAVIDLGQPIPEPATEQDFSGKVVLRFAKSLHRKASAYAEREGVSLNTFLVTAIAEGVGERSRGLDKPVAAPALRLAAAKTARFASGGRIVKPGHAKSHPKTAVTETVKTVKRGSSKKR